MNYRLLFLCCLVTACHPASEKNSTPGRHAYLEELSVAALQRGYRDKTYTIPGVVADYLARINDLDKNGPALNSVICINPDAITIAEALQQELENGHVRGPLHGIPVILKDNIDTHDKMPNTAGSRLLRQSFPAADSWVAHRLRAAGAVIIGKANLSEWANFRAQISSSGWSGAGGQTKNPYVLDCNPCGSSSGSGVAVAASLCAFAIGTETNGSIVCPSNANGIVGLKPTVGLISRTGIVPISFSQDTPGPMGRTVEDVAIALGAMVGVDSSDSKTLQPGKTFHRDYTQFLKRDGLKGKRIGIMRSAMGFHFRVDTLMNLAVAFLKSQGAEVIEMNEELPDETGEQSFEVLLYEFKDGLEKYFATLPNPPAKNLQEIIDFNTRDSVELRRFDQQLMMLAQAKGDLQSKPYQDALAGMLRGAREDGIDRWMNTHHLDAIMAPTGSPAWKTDLVNGDHFLGGSSSPAAIAGYPSIAVPLGFVDALPVDVSFFGRAWSEPILLEIAYAYEQGTKHRRAPQYLVMP